MTAVDDVEKFSGAQIRPVLMEVGHLGEQLCIAVVGWSDDRGFFASPVSKRNMACLPNELSHAVVNFGALTVADFLDWCTRGKRPADWTVPLSGLCLGQSIEVEAFCSEDLVRTSLDLTALWREDELSVTSRRNEKLPRTREEGRFLTAVETEVRKLYPSLADGFRRPLSMKGKIPAGEIDFLGSHYATCYAAINPKARSISRVQTASAALWRLARARDAFGFAAPACFELTAWIPQRGLPIYSEKDYLLVDEIVAELDEQAGREGLNIYSSTSAVVASQRLIESETNPALIHS